MVRECYLSLLLGGCSRTVSGKVGLSAVTFGQLYGLIVIRPVALAGMCMMVVSPL